MRRAAVTIAFLILATCSDNSIAEEPQPDAPAQEPEKKLTRKEIAENVARHRAMTNIEKRLKRVKPLKGQKAGKDDYFLVAKVEMTVEDKAAKVEFGVLQGQEGTKQDIYDYMAGTPSRTLRNWNVYARFADTQTAEAGLTEARRQYDELLAYQKEMMDYFQAASMCRT
jgi:hypothetical protein